MNNKGQTLIELVVGLGLLAVTITILSVATITGLQNSQFSKNQAQATKLAQEGMEKVRTIRNRNYTVCGPSPVTDWNSIYSTALTCQSNPSSCSYVLATAADPAPGGCTPTEFWLNIVNPTLPEEIITEGVSFSRLIIIKDYGTPSVLTQKEITVTVSWTDISGTHNSKLVTVMAEL